MTELTDEQINKRIYKLLGFKWNTKAGEYNYDFCVEWRCFGILWEWLQKHEQWEAFCEWYDIDGHPSLYTIDLISPPTLSRAVVGFFEEAHD